MPFYGRGTQGGNSMHKYLRIYMLEWNIEEIVYTIALRVHMRKKTRVREGLLQFIK